MVWDPIPVPFLELGLDCRLHGSYKHPCILFHLYLMMCSFFWYIVFFFVMLSFRFMCKTLRDKNSSIQFLVLFSKFNFLKLPIKSISNCIFCIFLGFWYQKKQTKDKKPKQVVKLLLYLLLKCRKSHNGAEHFYSPSIYFGEPWLTLLKK